MKIFETIHIETATRKKLKVWCARKQKTYTEAIEYLLKNI